MTMKMKNTSVLGIATAGALLLSTTPAMAQVQPNTHEVDVYAGYLFGDDITSTALDGRRPKLDDDLTFGVRYGYNFTDAWGLEFSVGHSPNSVTRLAGSDIDLDLTTIDANAVWHFNPRAQVVPYLTAGIGYAIADLDRPIQGTANGLPVAIDDDNGFTLNAGVGAKFFATDTVLIRLEARYRYLDKVVDTLDRSPSAIEATLGVGWQF